MDVGMGALKGNYFKWKAFSNVLVGMWNWRSPCFECGSTRHVICLRTLQFLHIFARLSRHHHHHHRSRHAMHMFRGCG